MLRTQRQEGTVSQGMQSADVLTPLLGLIYNTAKDSGCARFNLLRIQWHKAWCSCFALEGTDVGKQETRAEFGNVLLETWDIILFVLLVVGVLEKEPAAQVMCDDYLFLHPTVTCSWSCCRENPASQGHLSMKEQKHPHILPLPPKLLFTPKWAFLGLQK